MWGDLALPVKFKFLPNFEFLLHLKFVTPLIIFQVNIFGLSLFYCIIFKQFYNVGWQRCLKVSTCVIFSIVNISKLLDLYLELEFEFALSFNLTFLTSENLNFIYFSAFLALLLSAKFSRLVSSYQCQFFAYFLKIKSFAHIW